MGASTSEPISDDIREDTLFLLHAMWPLVMRESPVPFLRLGAQARAWAISLEATRAFGCFGLSCISFLLAIAFIWWPLGVASLGLSLAGTYRVRRSQALRLHWQRPQLRPLAHTAAFSTGRPMIARPDPLAGITTDPVLLEALKRVAAHEMTLAERHAQRRPWILGEMGIEHPEMSREQLEALADHAVGPFPLPRTSPQSTVEGAE